MVEDQSAGLVPTAESNRSTNLALLRKRGASYLVATPKGNLSLFEKELLKEDWTQVAGRPQIQVKLVGRDSELFVLDRSAERAEKERAIRLSALRGLRKDLAKRSKAVRNGRLRKPGLILKLEAAWPTRRTLPHGLALFKRSRTNRQPFGLELGSAQIYPVLVTTGAYLLRTNLTKQDPAQLWAQYVQLTGVEGVFRTLKSELNLRPIWHRIQQRVEAHILIASLGHC